MRFAMHRFPRQFALWAAIFAILSHALMPSIAQARAAFEHRVPAEICTVAGLKTLPAEKSGDFSSSSAAGAVHCLFCLVNGAVTLPPAAGLPTVRTARSAVWVAAIERVPTLAREGAIASPRGPPRFA